MIQKIIKVSESSIHLVQPEAQINDAYSCVVFLTKEQEEMIMDLLASEYARRAEKDKVVEMTAEEVLDEMDMYFWVKDVRQRKHQNA